MLEIMRITAATRWIWSQLRKYWWILAFVCLLGVGLWYLVFAFNRWANKSDGPKTAVVSDTPPSVMKANLVAETQKQATQESALTTNVANSLLVTNALKATTSEGAVVIATGSPNTIMNAGRDINLSGDGRVRSPTKTIRLKPDDTKPVGSIEDQILKLSPYSTRRLVCQVNWNFKTYADLNFGSDEFEVFVDNMPPREDGQPQDGKEVTYRNLTGRIMQVGVRCEKIRNLTTNDFPWELKENK